MDNYKELYSKFLIHTEHTGRFIVESIRTGIKYFVEPIGNFRSNWGDMDPATKKLTGSYGKKYRGSIDTEDSLITDEAGFDNIVTLDPGISPLAYINNIDDKRKPKKIVE